MVVLLQVNKTVAKKIVKLSHRVHLLTIYKTVINSNTNKPKIYIKNKIHRNNTTINNSSHLPNVHQPQVNQNIMNSPQSQTHTKKTQDTCRTFGARKRDKDKKTEDFSSRRARYRSRSLATSIPWLRHACQTISSVRHESRTPLPCASPGRVDPTVVLETLT